MGEVRRVESEDITTEFGRADRALDSTPLFSGHLTFKTKAGSFDVAAGEAFDVSPGHIPVFSAGCEWVQFTATVEQRKTDEAVQRNAAAATSTGDQPGTWQEKPEARTPPAHPGTRIP